MFFLFFHKTDTEVLKTVIPPFPCPNCGAVINTDTVYKIIRKGFFLLIPYKFTSYKVVCENCGKMVKLPKDYKGYLND